MEKNKKTKQKAKETTTHVVGAECKDRDCPFHGNLKARGRAFEGKVISKHPRRIAIEFERMIYVRKYERYLRARTKLHARVSHCLERDINVGDIVRIEECRPLSKIIHFVVIRKIKDKGDVK